MANEGDGRGRNILKSPFNKKGYWYNRFIMLKNETTWGAFAESEQNCSDPWNLLDNANAGMWNTDDCFCIACKRFFPLVSGKGEFFYEKFKAGGDD